MAQDELLAEDYTVDLEVFEGPLDLLLYLIRREEVDIYDIPIEKITRQYLAYLEMMRMLDLNIAGEFIVMATTLMMIKSRMLLPVDARSAADDSDEDWVDPRLDLVRQLIEYKKFKDAAGRLSALELMQSEAFAYGGDKPVFAKTAADADQALGDVDLFDLLTAFHDVLSRVATMPTDHIEPIRWSVPDKMESILTMTREQGRVAFSKLFHPASPRGEVIVTFLALLELMRQHCVLLFQNAAFHEIMILPAPGEAGLPPPEPEMEGVDNVVE